MTKDSKLNSKDNKTILFVGNDGNRDAELLKQIAVVMEDFDFTVVSKLQQFQNLIIKMLQFLMDPGEIKLLMILNYAKFTMKPY